MRKLAGRNYSVIVVILIIFTLLYGTETKGQNKMLKEDYESILTYPFSDPNPIPSLAINSMVSPFYPYFVFDGYTDKGINRDWKVVTLENRYIKVTIFPEVGGKVWGAIEKSTGREFIYKNKVLKFRAIGIRGPWTSGGIEHNFGLDLGHAPWTSSPVDYILMENPDSSASCVVGGIDLASRTQWRVTIHLSKDKAFFETNSLWYNPTPLHDAYLSWENAGFRASDDLQFYFPGDFYIGHDGAVKTWPVDEKGRDLSLYKENYFGASKSYHVSGLFTDWFGGYWHNDDFGFGHWAPYADAPGKKIWIWSLARDGAIWEDLLTDADGQYIEAQSGVKFNQASPESGYNSPYNQLSIRPYYTETKTESWFPVLKTGGMADASSAGTLNVINTDDSLVVIICPNTLIRDSLVILNNGKPFHSSFLDLKPLLVFRKAVKLPETIGTIDLIVGKDILTYCSDPENKRIDRPHKSAENGNFASAEHMFLLAEDMNAMRDFPGALDYYLKCLEKEPEHIRALYRVAELYYRMALYEKGAEVSRKVLQMNTYDAGGNFIYGMILRKLGDLTRAEESFSIASRTMEFRSGSFVQIAGIKMLKGDFEGATTYAAKALDFNRYSIPAYDILIISYRKLGKADEVAATIEALLSIDPLSHFARFEKYLLKPTPESLNNFKSLIRNELPHETYLELACEYSNMELYNEAIKLLEESPQNPIVLFWLAWLNRNLSPEKSSEYLRLEEEISPHLVFPFRHETIPVLNWVLEKNDSWKARYYLGLIYWHINRPEKALELFEQCGDIPDYAPFYISRAVLYKSISPDCNRVEKDFFKAVKLDPSEWRTWHFLADDLQSEKKFNEQLNTSRQAYLRFPENPVTGIDYVKALINTGNFTKSLKVLNNITILPQEGAHEGHDLYELANLSLAVSMIEQKKLDEAIKFINDSKNWPENLGAGKPHEPDIRFHNYLSSFCYKMTGKDVVAEDYSNQILEYSLKNFKGDGDPANIYISNRIFDRAGKHDIAVHAMEKWKNDQDSLRNWSISPGSQSPKVQWVMASFNNDKEKTTLLENEISSIPSEKRFRLLIRAINILNSKER